VILRSDAADGVADIPIDIADPAIVSPPWARYVAGVVAELRPTIGFTGTITSTLPAGAGLSSSRRLEVAVALALGATAGSLELAQQCQRAEQRSSGVPCGVMDQLASVCGVRVTRCCSTAMRSRSNRSHYPTTSRWSPSTPANIGSSPSRRTANAETRAWRRRQSWGPCA